MYALKCAAKRLNGPKMLANSMKWRCKGPMERANNAQFVRSYTDQAMYKWTYKGDPLGSAAMYEVLNQRKTALNDEEALVWKAKEEANCEHLEGVFRIDHIANLGPHYRDLQAAIKRVVKMSPRGLGQVAHLQNTEREGEETIHPYIDVVPQEELIAFSVESGSYGNIDASNYGRLFSSYDDDRRAQFIPPTRPPSVQL